MLCCGRTFPQAACVCLLHAHVPHNCCCLCAAVQVPKLHLCLLGWLAASSVLLRINRRGFAAAATAAEAHDATADLQVVGHTMRKMQALQFGGILGRSVDNSVPKSTRATQVSNQGPAELCRPAGDSQPDCWPWSTPVGTGWRPIQWLSVSFMCHPCLWLTCMAGPHIRQPRSWLFSGYTF
jgi:hypothetical protein